MSTFKGKKIMVIGGTSGIGLAAARQLRDEGANVIAVSRRGEIDKKSKGNNAKIKTDSCDVLDRDGLKALFKKHGKLDHLVCAATGGPRARGPFVDMDLDDFQGSFAKLWGYSNTIHAAAKHMNKKGSIAIVSGSPARKCTAGMMAISTVGGAVEAFAKAMAKELAPVRVNIVSPGLIDTPMSPLKGKERKDFYKNATANNLVPRAGTSEEVGAGIVFALSNDFMTGSTIDVDGGLQLP